MLHFWQFSFETRIASKKERTILLKWTIFVGVVWCDFKRQVFMLKVWLCERRQRRRVRETVVHTVSCIGARTTEVNIEGNKFIRFGPSSRAASFLSPTIIACCTRRVFAQSVLEILDKRKGTWTVTWQAKEKSSFNRVTLVLNKCHEGLAQSAAQLHLQVEEKEQASVKRDKFFFRFLVYMLKRGDEI